MSRLKKGLSPTNADPGSKLPGNPYGLRVGNLRKWIRGNSLAKIDALKNPYGK